MAETEPGFPLTVAVDAHGGTRTFATLDDYAAWIEAEDLATAVWRNVATPPVDQGWYRDARQAYADLFREANGKVTRYRNATRQPGPQSQKEQNQAAIATQIGSLHTKYYGTGKAFTSDSSEGQFLTRLSERAPMLAYGALVTLRGDAQPESPFGRGLVEGALFRLGINGRAEAEGDALSELAAQWRRQFQTSAEERSTAFETRMAAAGENLAAEQAALDALRAEHTAFMAELGRNQEAQAVQFHEALAEAQARLERTEELYRQQLGLAAPVSYWKRKASAHRWLAGGAFVLVAAVGGSFLWFFLRQVAAVLRPGLDPGTAEVVVLLTLATLGVWAVRIFVRLFFSQVHLNTDARERAVMIETFLALQTSGDASPEERLLVLQTIFRPSTTGIVRDDAAPPSVPSEISKLLNR